MTRFPRVDSSAAAGLFPALVAFSVYLATLCPTVPAGDSGELIAVAHTLGVAHPPGYPLYTLLGFAWSKLLPLGSTALELNLLSALFAAGAVGLVARVVRRLTASAAAAATAGLFLAFHGPFWKFAVVAEVFSLNAFLAALLLDFATSVLEDAGLLPGSRPRGRLRAGPPAGIAAVSTLLLSHHHTLVLLALPVAGMLILAPARGRRSGTGGGTPVAPHRLPIRAMSAGAAAGLLPLLYLPLAALRDPALNWGDPRTPERFLRLLLRAEYGTFRLDPEAVGLAADRSHVILFLEALPRDFTWAGIALCALGWIALARRHHPILWLAAAFATLQLLFLTRVNFPSEPPLYLGVVERFYILPAVVGAVVAGCGAAALSGSARRPVLRRAVATALVVAAAWPLAAHRAHADQRGNTFTADLARGALASVGERGVLFTRGDLLHNGLAWAQRVEGERPDVSVLDQELLTRAWYVAGVRRREPDLLPSFGAAERYDGSAATGTPAWLDHHRGRRPVGFIGFKESRYASRYELVPSGFVSLGVPRGEAPSLRAQAGTALEILDRVRLDGWFRAYDPRSFEAAERWRFPELAGRTAILLSRRECFDLAPATHPAFAKLIAFLDRHRAAPDPYPECLRAGGLLRAIHPAAPDRARALEDLTRYLALVPTGPGAEEARKVLAEIEAGRKSD